MGKSIWTIEMCKKEAKKYSTPYAFQIGNPRCYWAAKRHKWLKEVQSHMSLAQWTFQECLASAKIYKTRKEFKTKSIGAYESARRHGWLDKICSHMISGFDNLKWTKEECKKVASKFKTKGEFQSKNPGCYMTCLNNGWLKSVCTHMPKNASQNRHEEWIVQPKVKSYLKSLGLTVNAEVFISKKSRVDFVCTNKIGRKILIEVKSDKKRHYQKELTEQFTRYKREGKKKYGNKYAGVFLVSLNGRYGFALKELKPLLKSKGLV